MKIFPLLCLIFALAGCDRSDEPAAPEPPPALSLPNPESTEFADFLKAAALLSQKGKIIFRHPELPVPIHFSSWPPNDGDPVDPSVIQLIGDEIRGDSAEGSLMDTAALEAWAKDVIAMWKLVDEPPLVTILASEDPPVRFQRRTQGSTHPRGQRRRRNCLMATGIQCGTGCQDRTRTQTRTESKT